LYHHGGLCCGTKTIAGFPSYPESTIAARPKPAVPISVGRDRDKYGYFPDKGYPHRDFSVPEETAENRLRRYIVFEHKVRPGHMIEVILNQYQYGKWEKLLDELGFVETAKWLNSNSQLFCKRYQLIIEKDVIPDWVYEWSEENNFGGFKKPVKESATEEVAA
jgi:hypothetical protein